MSHPTSISTADPVRASALVVEVQLGSHASDSSWGSKGDREYASEYADYERGRSNPMPYRVWHSIYKGFISLRPENRELLEAYAALNLGARKDEIARRLYVGVDAVTKRERHVKRALGARSVPEAVMLAYHAGLIVPSFSQVSS